ARQVWRSQDFGADGGHQGRWGQQAGVQPEITATLPSGDWGLPLLLAAWRPFGAAEAAFLHLLQLRLLRVGQDLGQALIDFLLKALDLLFLVGREVQRILRERRQDLSGLRTAAEAALAARPALAALVAALAARTPWT